MLKLLENIGTRTMLLIYIENLQQFPLRNVKHVKWFQSVEVAVLFNGLHNILKIINNLKLKQTYDL